jgi:transcriptional regulator with XRE-family HTH domain
VALPKQFGDNLFRCRTEVGISQDELSVRASVHRTEISQLERGLRIPRVDTLVKLAGGLGVEPGQLLVGLSWKPGNLSQGNFEGHAADADKAPSG